MGDLALKEVEMGGMLGRKAGVWEEEREGDPWLVSKMNGKFLNNTLFFKVLDISCLL